MIISDEKIVVTSEMMDSNGMTRGMDFGVPIDPKDPSKGLVWKHLHEFYESDFDQIEEYFIFKQQQNDNTRN